MILIQLFVMMVITIAEEKILEIKDILRSSLKLTTLMSKSERFKGRNLDGLF